VVREFTKIGVVGLGTMGAGIAEVLARSGLQVVGVERDAAGLERAHGHLATSTRRDVGNGKLTDDEATALLARISTGTDLTALAECELVIEAIPERMDSKRDAEIDGVEQLTRYLQRLSTVLGPVRGVLAAQSFKPQAKVLAADRGITCVQLDYDALRGMEAGTPTLF
jgi:UDP-N-acetyl-D-mannosaminuronate dehydrogenase